MAGVTNYDCLVNILVTLAGKLRQFNDVVAVIANGQSATARCVLSTNWRNIAAKKPQPFSPSVTGFETLLRHENPAKTWSRLLFSSNRGEH